MKILTSLILMTVSTFAFAGNNQNQAPIYNSHFLISDEQHNELEAKYQDLIHEVNASLTGPKIHHSVVLEATTQSVVYRYMPCNKGTTGENAVCVKARKEFTTALVYDVFKSSEYDKLYWASIEEDNKDSEIKKFLFGPAMSQEEREAAKEHRKIAIVKLNSEKEVSNKALRLGLIVISSTLLIFGLFLSSTIVIFYAKLWLAMKKVEKSMHNTVEDNGSNEENSDSKQ